MQLSELGYSNNFRDMFHDYDDGDHFPGRVSGQERRQYRLMCEQGEMAAVAAGRLYHKADDPEGLPAVGDWTVCRKSDAGDLAVIEKVLPRASSIQRKSAGQETITQVLAANVDVAFLVSGLDNDFNLRRIERFLTLSWESGARPVIVLNKIDLHEDISSFIDSVESIAYGLPLLKVSALNGVGVDDLREFLADGLTGVFLGSSGVGKSSLINHLLGENRQLVHEVREDDQRGRHTTTSRNLLMLPGGGLVIDTPGLREIQLWNSPEGLKRSFDDIEQLALGCRFNDCAHEDEPGCAVREAIETGELDRSRFQSYRKLQKEQAYLERKQDSRASRQASREFHRKVRTFHKQMKDLRKRGLA
jgi:ribosome biogenesis GTPase